MGEYKRLALLVFVIIGALLIVGASAGHAAQAETKEVVAAVARDFYPEYVVDADGRPGGFGIDLMNAVAKRAGLSVTYRVFETWSDLIAALERGDADLVPVVSVTRAREGRMLFTRPVVTSPSSLFVRQDTDDVRGWTDLAGRRVAVIEGGVSEEILSERETSARLVPYARLQDALFDLLSGEVDALVSFESSVWKVSERARLADRIKVVGEPLTEAKRAIAVRQDLPGLRDRLDAAVADFLDSSEYRKLYSEWYAAAPSFWTSGRIGWLAGASTALLLLGMLVWQSLSLRAESRRLAESAPGKLPGERAAIEFPARVISQACGLIALALGLAVLLGWVFDVTALKSVLPGLFAMQPWAATAIALAGGALLAATAPGRIAAAVSMALAGMVLIIGLQTLLQYTDGARPRHRSVALPDGRQQSAGPSAPGPGRRGHVDRLRLARCDASARSRRESLGTSGFLHHRHRRAALDGRAATRLPDRRRYAAIRGLLHPYRPARGARSRRPFPGRVGAAPGYGLDGLALRRYAGCHFGPHAAARCRGRPGTARLAVHFGKASRALRAGLPSWAHHAGHHRAAGKRLAVECCAPRSPASRPTGRGGGAAPKRGTIPHAGRGTTGPDLSVSAGHDAHLRQPGVCRVLRSRAGRADRQALARLRGQGRAATVPRRAVVVHARASGAARGNPQHAGRP